MTGRVHVVGAGVAGLAAAVRLAGQGKQVSLWEAAGQGGGRCRSFLAPTLGRRIDNGNHLFLSGNTSVAAYLAEIGGTDGLVGPERAEFHFFDQETGERWCVSPNRGWLPWWLLSPKRRAPGTGIGDYLKGLQLAYAGSQETVAERLGGRGVGFRCFWEPLTVSVLNTAPEEASARSLWPMLYETFGRGEKAARPRVVRIGLSETFVDPALAFLEKKNATITFNRCLKRLETTAGRVSGLDFGDKLETLGENDAVILATPPPKASELLPNLAVPTEFRTIINAHFRLGAPRSAVSILGLVGGTGHWLFVRGDVASVTVSAAGALAFETAETIAGRIWPEVARALELGEVQLPPHRIIKERRATIAQTPAQEALRPSFRTDLENLFLAGDWTNTGLPATIEGAVRSGHRAAQGCRFVSGS